jgi:hypothetical protein
VSNSIARSLACAVRAQRFDNLEANRIHRVERRHGLLEDHGNLVTANFAQLAFRDSSKLATEQLD